MSSPNPVNRALGVKYTPELALVICEQIADGKSISEIAEIDGMPARNTIYRWLAVYPKFFDAFQRAKEVSAMTFEERALAIAAKLEMSHTFTASYISGLNYAMQQYRWTASRRNKTEYGQQVQTITAVPITINTSLNLGQEGMGPATTATQSIYTIEATAPSVPAVVSGYDDDTVEEITMQGEVVDLSAQGDENEARAFGLPETETQQLHNPRPGRPKKRHKSPAQVAATAARYARRKKSTE